MNCTLFLAVWAAVPLAAQQFTDELWRSAAPVYEKTLSHPFLQGLSDGTLPREKFRFYLMQDLLYLRGFSQVLLELASKAPDPEWARTLARHATEALEEEERLHLRLLEPPGARPVGRIPAIMSPTNAAYTNHLLVAALRGSFPEAMAAVLPCYWVYQKVGKSLARKGSPNSAYRQWIGQYSGAQYAKSVDEALAIMNAAARRASPREKENAVRLFERSARYEYMFWDMAWRMEHWPPD